MFRTHRYWLFNLSLLAAFVVVLGCGKAPDSQPQPDPKASTPPGISSLTPGPDLKAGATPGTARGGEPALPEEKGPFLNFRYSESAKDLPNVKAGDSIRLRGQCEGKRADGVWVSQSERYYGRRPAISATEIVSAYEKDPVAADNKYKEKDLVIDGVYAGADPYVLRVSGSKSPAKIVLTPNAKLKDALSAKPDVTLTAKELLENKDAEKTYKNKIVEISSFVVDFESQFGVGDLIAIGDNKLGVIRCTMIDREPWNRLSYGQQVRIRGKCATVNPLIQLINCIIIDTGPSVAVSLTAEDLAKEYAADSEKTDDKYNPKGPNGLRYGKSLVVTGEVAAWGKDDYGKSVVFLKGTNDLRLACQVGKLPESDAPVGAKIRVVAYYDTYTDKAKGEKSIKAAFITRGQE